ncbi:MAG: hypothetical protein Q4E57_09045 [Eubacteriales bacterium]|nr:hypothetical protein [Eubacteriales bacterium]
MKTAEEQIERGISLIEGGFAEEAEKYLRVLRCGMMDELHDSQARVDRLDFLIYSLKKNQNTGK